MRRESPAVDAAAPGMYSDLRSFRIIYEQAMLRWISGRYDTSPAETWMQFLARIDLGIAKVREANAGSRTVMIFTSGGPISAVMRLALGLTDETALRLTWVIKNASLSSLLFNREKLTLSLFNSTAHLEQEGDQGLITYR
jgi:broad specificity phosphatase PhoE